MSGESIPPWEDMLWGGMAGLCGGVGLLILYRALASGRMSVAAPISGVLAASLPVLTGMIIEGIPGFGVLAGIALALGAVWLISGGGKTKISSTDFGQPVIAGLAFGGFLIFLDRASGESLWWPLISVRVVSITSLLSYSIITRQPWRPTRASLLPLVLSSILDTIGNACYALSARTGRLDVAAVISSLYPGATVLLAWVFLKERISRVQAIGILLALSAIILLTT